MAQKRQRQDFLDVSDSGSAMQSYTQRPRTEAAVNALRGDQSPCQHSDYTIAWICALYLELAAAKAVLDTEYTALPTEDDNHYTLGSIDKHNIVIAVLPDGHHGTVRAAHVLSDLQRTFTSVDRCLLVGIGGGFPRYPFHDIRLGDIVVGQTVVAYNEGKRHGSGRFERTGDITRPSPNMLTALSTLRANHEGPATASKIVSIVQERFSHRYQWPDADDHLFSSDYQHGTGITCRDCNPDKIVPRDPRPSNDPEVHYGRIASGDTLIKHSKTRDRLAQDLDVLCIEMEAAGIVGKMPTLVIRGVSDYADSHKNDAYQKYAAANAAAFAREYLEVLKPGLQRLGSGIMENVQSSGREAETENEQMSRREKLLKLLKFEEMNSRLFQIEKRQSKTCEWVLNERAYRCWVDDSQVSGHLGFIWLKGKPGAGKSTLMKFLHEKYEQSRMGSIRQMTSGHLRASFFFHARGEELQHSIEGLYRALIVKLFEGYPDLKTILDDEDIISPDATMCPPLDRLKTLFEQGISRLGTRQFTCYIDALDECDEKQVAEVVSDLQNLVEEHNEYGPSLRIFVSSRHYPRIEPRLGLQLVLDSLPGHYDDMRIYVQARLNYKNADLRARLINKAQSVFLWLILVVNILNDHKRIGHSISTAAQRLDDLPGELSDLYGQILARHGGNMDEFVIAIIWILYAKRPLSPKEFYHAHESDTAAHHLTKPPAIESEEQVSNRVTHVSKGFAEIVVHKRSLVVQLIHESVRDFLVKEGGLARVWPQAGGNLYHASHDRLKQACQNYLSLSEVQAQLRESEHSAHTLVHLERQYPFLQYSAQHILDHADKAAGSISQAEFLHRFPKDIWVKAINIFNNTGSLFRYTSHLRYTPATEMLYLLADGGYARLIHKQSPLPDPLLINPQAAGRYKSPVIAALVKKHLEAASILLGVPRQRLEGRNLLGGNKEAEHSISGRSLLSWAAEEGHHELLLVLVETMPGAVNALDPAGYSPLARAILAWCNDQIVRVLMNEGAECDPDKAIYFSDGASAEFQREKRDRFRAGVCEWILLHNNQQQAIPHLISSQVDLQASIWLSIAARVGNFEAVQFLVAKGADVNRDPEEIGLFGDMYGRPLTEALHHPHQPVAEYLLQQGADILAGGIWEGSPFEMAVKKNSVACLNWLADRAPPGWHRVYGGKPLTTATQGRRGKSVRWLVDNGVGT